MCKKLIFLVSPILLLVLVGNAPADLVVHWSLEEGSGTIATDVSGNGNDGTFVGAPEWVDGYFGGGLHFRGDADTDSVVYTIPGGDTVWETGTIAIWVKADSLGQDNWSSCFTNYTPNSAGIQFDVDGGNPGNYRLNPGGQFFGPATTEWTHLALTFEAGTGTFYYNGVEATTAALSDSQRTFNEFAIGINRNHTNWLAGIIDELRIYDHALTADEIQVIMESAGGKLPLARRPEPADGAVLTDTWVSLSWKPGDFAVSHDVYMGDIFDDVNAGTGDTFQGNQSMLFFTAGFPGNAYPDGLVPGTTYYWRIDEVNENEPNSPWKGNIWSFSIPPKTAYAPDPAEGAELVDLNVVLSWTAGFGAKLHYIVFGEDFDEVSNAAMGIPRGSEDYTPGPLELAKTYYWRVDEFDGPATHKGEVWSFTTEGAVSGPNPADGALDVKPTQILSWDAGAVAASHEVYFGTDTDAVKNATTASPEYKGPKALGEESYDPDKLILNKTYYWRIDEVNDNPDSPWAGNVWSFTTGDYFVIDDFEHYDANDNQIWAFWHDGLGFGAPGTPDFFAGNGTGAAVGDENTPSYTEETIIHSGSQSMPIAYDNNKQGYAYYSEVEKTLGDQRDWSEQGVAELSLWFRGNPASVGSFVEDPVGTYTITASGADIWNQADEFHFASKILTGPGSIVARVESVEQTDNWAKAGVMIRETLDTGSKFAAVYITPTNADGTATNGCRFQARIDMDASATSDTSVATSEQTAIVAPYWVKLERDVGGNFRGYYSSNGSTWQSMSWNPQSISMSSNVYIGLALTSHNNSATCEAVFSNVTITGTVGPQWANQDVGIASNAVEPLYVAVSNSAGTSAVMMHDDVNAATIDVWTEWIIPLSALADQGIILTDVDRIAIGLGTQGNMTIPGGSGKMYFDDIRLYRPRPESEPQP